MHESNSKTLFSAEKGYKYLSTRQLKKQLKLFYLLQHPFYSKVGKWVLSWPWGLVKLFEKRIRNTFFSHFCGGETLEEVHKSANELYQYKVASIPDYSVEGLFKQDLLDNSAKKIEETIRFSSGKDVFPFAVFKFTGISFFDVLEKRSGEKISVEDEEGKWLRVNKRVNTIIEAAKDEGVRLLVDAEESWIQPAIDQVVMLHVSQNNHQKALIYNTYQMYLKDGLKRLKLHHQECVKQGCVLGVKLVRGAYMEKERARAKEKGYPSPIHHAKSHTDEMYNEALDYCLENLDTIHLFVGTHNENSIALAMELMKEYSIDANDQRVWFSQLKGMGDHISFPLANKGYNVCKYVPFGPMKFTMPYLLRRAQENSSADAQSSQQYKLLKEAWELRKVSKR